MKCKNKRIVKKHERSYFDLPHIEVRQCFCHLLDCSHGRTVGWDCKDIEEALLAPSSAAAGIVSRPESQMVGMGGI